MRILVAIKSVAILEEENPEFRSDGRDVEGGQLEHYLNEWDDYSIGEAVKIKEASEQGVEVVAVTVGGDYAEDALQQCLAKGADRAVRVWDEVLDEYLSPLTTARIISEVARNEDPDMLFTGVQSNDQVFSATGTAVAAYLDWPHSTAVSKVEWTPGDDTASLTRGLEAGISEKLEIQCPAVLVIQSGANALRYPTLRDVKNARSKQQDVLSLSDLSLGDGALSEPEFNVRRMYVPEKVIQVEMLEGSADEQAARLIELVKQTRGE